MKKSKKLMTAVVAVLAVAVLAITGTLAWQSLSQTSAFTGELPTAAGGRLHRDDDGATNKDIYVENYGEAPIFARVRLDEYMELGEDAGTNADDANRAAASVLPDAKLGDKSTWRTRTPDTEDGIAAKWTWETGGKTTYIPTFNKDNESLAADSRDYASGETLTAGTSKKTDTAALGKNQTAEETHTAKETGTATVVTMEEWLKNPVAGNYWVWDEDGWFYWAQPIAANEATGLLLSGATLNGLQVDQVYYGIDAVGQFATAYDLGKDEGNEGFYDTSEGTVPSDNAEKLLETIGAIGQRSIVITSATTNMEPGESITLTGQVMKADGSVDDTATAALQWSLSGNGSSSTTIGAKTGELTVSSGESVGRQITVTATYTNPTSGTAVTESKVITVVARPTVTVSGASSVEQDSSSTYTATVRRNGSTVSGASVSWSVSGSGCSIQRATNTTGKLTVSSSATAGSTATVTASYSYTSAAGNRRTVTGTAKPTILAKPTVTVTAANNVTEVELGETLNLTAAVKRGSSTISGAKVNWSMSPQRQNCSISSDGVLYIGYGDVGDKFTVTATYTRSDGTTVTGSITLTLAAKPYVRASGPEFLERGSSGTYTAKVTRNSIEIPGAKVTWSLFSGDGCSIDENTGVLTVPEGSTATSAIVEASYSYTSAAGNARKETSSVVVTIGEKVTISLSPSYAEVEQGGSQKFTATVKEGSSTVSGAKVTWSIESNGSGRSSITSNGTLTVSSSATVGSEIRVTATYTSQYGVEHSATSYVNVKKNAVDKAKETIKGLTPDSRGTVTIDGTAFYVMAKDGDYVLLWAKDAQGRGPYGTDNYVDWQDQDCVARTYLNGEWYDNHPTLQKIAVSRTYYSNDFTTTSYIPFVANYDKVFLPSAADYWGQQNVAGTQYWNPNNYTKYYTYVVNGVGQKLNFRNQSFTGLSRSQCIYYTSSRPSVINIGSWGTTKKTDETNYYPLVWVKVN